MTPQEHNKALGICHLVYGGLHTLMLLAMVMIFWGFARIVPPGGPPPEFFLLIGMVMLVFNLIFTFPSFVAGYALLKRKPWARTASLIAAVLEAMSVPIGTAVCIYSFWFMLSEPGKRLYERPELAARARASLHDASPQPAAWWREPAEAAQAEPVQPPPTGWREQ